VLIVKKETNISCKYFSNIEPKIGVGCIRLYLYVATTCV